MTRQNTATEVRRTNTATEGHGTMERNVNLRIRDALLKGIDSPDRLPDDKLMVIISDVEATIKDEEAQRKETELTD